MSQQKFGRYIIKGTLGRGAMGMVYLALDPILDRLSAIKVMNTGGEVDEGLRTRFFREAKSAARLRHPNIIAIYEMGEEEKRPFIAMEYVEGEDLKSLIEKRTFIPFEQKIRILIQVCEALSYAHQQGVIHRDIKPANVRIAQDGEVRILDFGLARLGSSDITRTGMLMGTPYYMSPEQVRGVRDLDGRSDLFSAAVLLYELLAYARPFEAESSTEVCLKIVSEPHTPLASVLPKVDADLVAIIDRALSKNRDARQPGCQDLARALKEYALTVPQRMNGLEPEVARLEKEWRSCCDASQPLVQLGILEESLLAPLSPTPAPAIDPEETTVYNFSLEAYQRDFGALLLMHARLHGRLEEIRQRLRAAVPLQELFERGQQQLEQGEFEDSLKTSAEILEMVPLNARALDMQRECRRLIEERRVEEERQARLRQALAAASEALEQGTLAQCIQLASRALQIDPGNNQAQELKQQASDALVRRRKIAELLAAARGFHKAQNYESACEVCAEALALEPGHAELRVIQQQSQQIIERQSQIREWLIQAQEKLLAGDYMAVLGITDQLLTLEPNLPRALEMQQQAAEALERQLKLEELVAVARGCEMAGDFEECLRVCDQALQISSENPEIRDLGERASQTLAKQRRVAELLSRGRQEIERGEFALATETCREAIGLDPGDRTAQELLRTAEAGHHRQQRVAELLALAQSHQAQRNFQGCLDVTNEALILDSVHPGHLEMRRLALDSLERVRQFEQHVEAARQCDEVEDYARALEHLERALELDDGNAAAVELKQHVATKLDRRNQLSACLEAARQQLHSEHYAECVDSAQRALQLDADNAEARTLCAQATEALARLERANRLLTQARRHFEEQQYEMAIEGAEELLRLNPHHAGARALKQEAIETQERRQRFEACLVAARNHAKSQDYSACLAAATEALEIEPQHAELRRLQERAMQALEKERAIAAGLERCRQYLAKEDYGSALGAADDVLRLEPKHRDALTLQRQATEELENQQRFEELLVLARNHSKAQDHAACLKAANEALAFKPEHPELRKLRDKSSQVLARLRAIEVGLAKVRQALSEERFLEAQGAAQEVLTLEPQHTETLELARAASEGRQRQQRIEQLAEEAQRKLEQRDYPAGLGAAEEGLSLRGNHAALLQLHKTLKQALERQQTLAGWIEDARKQLDVRDFAGAIETCDQCLELEADHSEAWKLHQAASEGMERRQKVDDLQATAKGYYTAKDYDACLKSVQEALSLEPDDTELQTLQREASQALEREQRLAALLENAQRSFQEQRFTEALGFLNDLLSTDASHAAATRLKEKVSREWQRVQQVEQLLGEARDLASEGKWETCRKKAQEALKLAPNHEELQQILDRSQRELEKLKRIAELLKRSRTAFEERRFDDVAPLVAGILELDSGHPEASELRGKAVASLERQRQIRELLQAAQTHEAAQEPELALQKTGEGLRLDPGNVAFLSIQRWATGALEHQRRVNALLHEAQQQASEGDWESCRKQAQEGLKLAPNHEELQQIHDRAQRELEKLKRIAELLKKSREAFEERRFDDVVPLVAGILELDSRHQEASELRGKAAASLERQRQIRELLQAVQAHEAAQEPELALQKAGEGLRLDSGNVAFLSIQRWATGALEHQRRVSALLHEAQQQASEGNWESCRKLAQEGLKLAPNNEDLQQINDRSQRELEKLKRIAELLKRSRTAFEERRFDDVAPLVAGILELDSGHPEASELREKAAAALERQRQIHELLQAAQTHEAAQEPELALQKTAEGLRLDPGNTEFISIQRRSTGALELQRRVRALLHEAQQQASEGNWEPCRKKAQEGLKLAPNHEELQQILDRSQRELEKLKRIAELFKNCRALFQAGQFEDVLPVAGQILELDPSHAEASELRRKATAALEQQRQVRELLEAAQAHERAGELELALEKARAGLQLEARNSQFLSIQSRATAALEHRRRVSALLSEARQQLSKQQYEASLRASEELLKLEPEHAEAPELKQAAASALERLRQLNQSLAQAKAKAKASLWEECLKVATEGLRLDPTHAELMELAAQASEILDKRRTLQELLDSGRGQLGRGEHEAAVKSAERALQWAPDNAEAAQLRQQAQNALEARRKKEQVAALLAEARKHEQSGDVEACYRTTSEGLNLEPEHAELKALRESSGRILETRRQIQILLERARQQWQAEDLPKVVETAVSLLKLDPGNAKAADFKLKAEQEIDRRQRLKELLNQARRADKERDYEACLRAAEEGLTLNSGHTELQRLQSRSRQMLEQMRRMAQLLQDARAEIEAQNYAAALKALDSALQLDGSNTEAAQLKQKAQEAWERQKRLEGLLNDAQRQLKAGQFEACLESAGQGLALEAGHALFKELTVEAKRQLELRRQIGEGLKRAAQHLAKKEYRPAVEAYDSVLKLAPGQAEATEGRQRAQQALQRQQRLEECLARAQAAFDAKDFQTCQTAAKEGLGLEPGHPKLQGFAKQAAEIIERTRRVQQLWHEASQSQQKGDLPGCLRSLDLLLELEPENAAARDLRPKVVEALEKQRRAAGLLAEAASLEKSGDLERCQQLAEQALQIEPNHSQAQQFHQRISLALERRRQIQKLLEQAVAQFKEQDDAGALKVAQELLRLDPAHPRGLEIQSLASKRLEHRQRLEELLLQARQARDARDPAKCLRAAEQGLQLEPGHVEFKQLEAQSHQQLEQQRKIRELVSECQRQLGAGAFEGSIEAARTLESLDPGNTVAAEIRQKANEGLERGRRVQALLARALELSAAGDLAACHSLCGEALQLDPSNTELLELRDRAFQVFESRRREEELRARLQQLLASAKDSLQRGRFRAAQRDLTALLELDAAHAEACRLLAEAESQLALAREKNLRLAKLAAAAVLVVSLLGSGVWYGVEWWGEKASTPPSQSNSTPTGPKPQLPDPQIPQVPPAEDREVANLVDTALGLLRARKYPEAAEAAEKLLVRSPNHPDGVKVQRESRRSLEKIDDGLRQASTLFERGRYVEVATALGSVLALDADHPEALRLMARVDQYARSNAQDAQKQMLEIKQRAAQAGAPSLVQNQYQTASSFETDAIRLFERKRFGEATGKFYEASEAYVVAESEARKAAELARETAEREKTAKDNNELAAKAAERRQQEQDRQITQQRNQAQSAWDDYQKALSRASQAGADRLASDIYQQANSLGMYAQEKFNQGNYAGAQTDFRDALRQLESAMRRAEDSAQQGRQEDEKQQKERAQRAEDVRAIQQALRLYQGAMENKDIVALKGVWPGMSSQKEQESRQVFKDSRSIRVELEPLGEPRFSEASAVVSCRKIQRVVFSNGQKFDPRFDSKFTLRKRSGGWFIESIDDVVQPR